MGRVPQMNSKRRHAGGTLVGIFIGLVIGLAIAAAVTWYLNRANLPFQLGKAGNGDARSEVARPQGGPQSLPAKPGDKATDKRFTFYDILPGRQEAVPGTAPATPATPAPTAPASATKTASAGEALYLQVGAFQKPAEADNVKARLALIGVEASVKEVAVPDKGTMFRVRVGPYAQVDEMNRVRNLLTQNGIPVSVVRAKEAGN